MFAVFAVYRLFEPFSAGVRNPLAGPPIEIRTADGLYYRTADGVYFGVSSNG